MDSGKYLICIFNFFIMQTQNATIAADTATAQTFQVDDDVVEAQRTKCEVWTRVMGYHRPVQNFNVGKKSEHYSRQHFVESVDL